MYCVWIIVTCPIHPTTWSWGAIYETVKELITPKDWYVETVDTTEEIEGKEKKKKEAKNKVKSFDFSKIDNATTIKQLKDAVKELLKDIVELNKD